MDTLRRMGAFFIGLPSVLSTALFITTVFLGCSMNHLSAAEFFDGRHLEAAQAIKSGNIEHLRLAARGLDIDKPGKKEMTLLWFAIMNKNFEAIRVLVRLGSNPGGQVAQGLGIPVDYALRNTDLRFLGAMLDGGMSVNLAGESDETVLHKAAGAFGATIDHVKLLVARGADLDRPNQIGETPLLSAIFTNQPERALYLLEQGAKVNAYTSMGVTPASAVESAINGQQPGSPMRRDFERLRDRMIVHGVKFPPDPPDKVRAWMKTQGMRVAK